MNSVVLSGLPSGLQVHVGPHYSFATFRLVVPRPDGGGVDMVDVVTFDEAMTGGDHPGRGTEVVVVGRLRHTEEVSADGRRRSRLHIVAEAVQVLDTLMGPMAG